MDWEPVDLEMEVPEDVWDRFLTDIQVWNAITFGQKKPVWIDLTEDEAPEALAHYNFRPLVRRILHPSGEQTLTFHLATRRVVNRSDSFLQNLLEVRVREERMAATISGPTGVRFALCGELPGPVLRIAQATLSRARDSANSAIRAVTGESP